MSDIQWDELARRRGLGGVGPANDQLIDELLDQLASQGDIDAVIQKELEALDQREAVAIPAVRLGLSDLS